MCCKVDRNAFMGVLRVKVQRSKVAPGLHGLPGHYDFCYLLFIPFAKENKRIGVGLHPGLLFKGIQHQFWCIFNYSGKIIKRCWFFSLKRLN